MLAQIDSALVCAAQAIVDATGVNPHSARKKLFRLIAMLCAVSVLLKLSARGWMPDWSVVFPIVLTALTLVMLFVDLLVPILSRDRWFRLLLVLCCAAGMALEVVLLGAGMPITPVRACLKCIDVCAVAFCYLGCCQPPRPRRKAYGRAAWQM